MRRDTYRTGFLAAAAIEPTSVVLDVGCGTGQLARETARLATGSRALGVDLSFPMIELACERGQRGVPFSPGSGKARVPGVRYDSAAWLVEASR
ncbi:class I SAM-dependent methyltransferase [Amycolatopsis sp. YIM 10]|uniref:class I SAM-dependent methyltransferase n=1 Tax=Amycolatopsis sp. YIM 10 TaxID=2653857 RepID=UPI001D1371BE|nr:class I SAM-dependent methyltransferase [Amycolatopsis sp. YIM 10]